MKKIFVFLVTISLISCKNELEHSNEISSEYNDSTRIKAMPTTQVLKTDTLKLEKTTFSDKIVITTLKKEISKDSIGTGFFRLDFYNKNRILKSFPISITYGREEGDWYSNDNVFENNSIDFGFVEISYGYPACGYTHTNFLFFMDANECQLVTKNESMADGGYGTWTKFEPIISDNQLFSFTSKVIQVDADESKPYNEDDENLTISYSDSIVYVRKYNKWIGDKTTPKEKIFRKEFTTYNKFHKNDD